MAVAGDSVFSIGLFLENTASCLLISYRIVLIVGQSFSLNMLYYFYKWCHISG